MSASLSSLVDNLSEINKKESVNELIKKFPATYRFCKKDLNKFALLLKKGVYPYEYMDSWERFNEALLPSKESFYSELHKEDITDEDYNHAKKIWEVFTIKSLGEFHDLYVQSDTLLLADVCENFRDRCINTYELDPAHFLSSPRLGWQACLKKTNMKLELLTDNDMLIMEEKGIRGGVCNATLKYAEANNKYMKDYDENIASSFLEYIDANNLCGWAMSEKLPKIFISYIVIYHSYQKERKLINVVSLLILCIIKKHIIHIRALKQALNHGLKLTKVHRVISFRQEAWLKPYIDMNTKLRTEAKNEFEKDFFKLMNKSVFGKTMENVRNHRDVKIVTTNKQRMKFASEPNYHTTKQMSEDLLIMEMKKLSVTSDIRY